MSNSSVEMFGRVPSRRARRAYTLLEVLVVIGIIALLASILLAMLSKVREAGRRTTCLNNVQLIAKAVLLYVNDNEGAFPFSAAKNADMIQVVPSGTPEGHRPEDWIYWQSGPNDKLSPAPSDDPGALVIHEVNVGGIGKYLGCNDGTVGGLQTLRCPSDVRLYNSVMVTYTPDSTGSNTPYPLVGGQTPYPFSYVLNALMSSGNNASNGAAQIDATLVARTLARVKDPGTKILVYEEDPRTIDDGNGVLAPTNTDRANILSIRHEGIEVDPTDINQGLDNVKDPIMVGYSAAQGNNSNGQNQLNVTNPGKRGNVAFCDGHAEFIQRGTAHLKEYWAPDPTMVPSVYP